MVPLRPGETSHRLVAGRYEILGEVARGGCGAVYEAEDLVGGGRVAIKILQQGAVDRASLARFAREARVAAAIHHPNVCGVVDSGTLADGSPFIAMERLYGETLRQHIGRVRMLDPESAIELAVQLLSGLDAAHDLGIVHRDVKPENVFLVTSRSGGFPLVKILDFGMCRVGTPRRAPPKREVVELVDDKTLTRAGTVVGTPEYMAPEQASGRRHFDLRIDLYAVGVLLYEALTGTRAFYGADPRAVLVNVLARQIPPVRAVRPDLPLALDRIVARAIERDPRARYGSAMEFQHDLLLARTTMRRQRAARVAAERQLHAHLPRLDLAAGGDEWEMPTRELRRSG
ncbi:MAG: serine/threonine protein kinase [Deltaproteobacteria bacterium]|nr:serine/threonine protein kinase [Deltaproteobacteria bacterium]